MCTYDSLAKVAGITGYNYFLLIDELHLLFIQYVFRNKAVRTVLDEYKKFKEWSFLTATPIEYDLMLEELKDIPTFKIDWEDKTEVKVNAVQCKYVGATVKKVINDFLEGKIFGNAHFFVNSVEFIATMIKNCNLTNENTRIIFSKNNESYKHTCQGVTNGETTDPVKKINFYTSTCFEGCDLFDTEGKILIGEDGLIKKAADGHGGIYESLVKNGMTEKMRQLGVEWVFIGGVDNCLVKMVDPVLMGIAIDKKVTVACKSIVKANPHEKVGVFCKRNGKPSVIEYSEITDEMAEAVDENGELLYGESHILCNLFNIEAIERMGANPLPYHSAYKKAKYIDKDGNLVVPTSPNAYKFEAFLFDAFGKVDDMAILRVKREEEFAPVKNSDEAGVDCPSTARELYEKFYHLK